ncbi:MAG: hypothetical protein HYV06_07945 [Deltaproteobacteria bacterium]|nr:hypothetical protein [Deltaproteobacteria bacterium]
MLYFVKNSRLHRYPLPKRCSATYEHEQLRDSVPHGVEQCVYCMRVWPGEVDNPRD